MIRPNFMIQTSDLLPIRYDFRDTEARILKAWRDAKAFSSAYDASGKIRDPKKAGAKPYVIAIPPPNVTGRLHIGHALNNTIQDMLIRFKRMDGFDALWVPGTDHAGISTQSVVKKALDAQGIHYRTLGREAFVEKVWEWKKKYGDLILHQLERMGCSCDWERTRFTMDEGLSHAVVRAFKKLYDEGLIYRGKRIVNWCPADQTALSDDEVETKEGGEPGFLWKIRYKFADGKGELLVATTRPETLFGDVAVAVHPEDERYKKYIGKEVLLPLTDKKIPVIADDYVDRTFGTGCLKITPAHDPNDFEVGLRHKLEPVNIMNPDATMNENVPSPYRGLSREKCRDAAVKDLEAKGLLESVEPRMTPVGRAERSKVIIEYRLSEQWFVKMKPLAEKTLALHDQLNIVPKQWDKVYLHWMNGIRDWCISRQLWWGHRIPAWHHVETGEILVDEKIPDRVKAEPKLWKQDEDVLDTWFSSDLWPMSILGWPEASPDFKRYFPTTTLSTAHGIIYLWVARMNIMSVHFTGKLPYENVYVHPTLMDERGETMSKSKGNGVDPVHIIDGATAEDLKNPVHDARPSNMKELLARIDKNYPEGFPGVGADALRYTLIYLNSSGQELKLSLANFTELGQRFITKLWNAARFILMNAESLSNIEAAASDKSRTHGRAASDQAYPEDEWLGARLKAAAAQTRRAYESHDFTVMGQIYYQLVWNDFCDWYVEIVKVRLQSEDASEKRFAVAKSLGFYKEILRLIHPLMPFVTEELWSKLGGAGLLMLADFPKEEKLSPGEEKTIRRFSLIQDLVAAVRSFRANYQVPPKDKLRAYFLARNPVAGELIELSRGMILRLAGLESFDAAKAKPEGHASVLNDSAEIFLDARAYRDTDKEKARLNKELEAVVAELGGVEKRLANAGFVAKAKPEVIEKEREKQKSLGEKRAKLELELKELV